MKNQTIGVEIEMTGISRKKAAAAVAKYFGTEAIYTDDDYFSYEVKDTTGRTWSFKYDSSITTFYGRIHRVNNSDDYAVELVTPILNYDDIETLQEVVNTVKKAGAVVNESCGLHVHIGANDFGAKQLKNLLKYVASREELFYSALNVYESRKRFCRPTNERILKEIIAKNPKTLEEFANIWYSGSPSRVDCHYDDSRYTICNLHSFFNHGTIEYRIFNSTLDTGEIKAYIQFCLALTAYAKTVSYTVYKPKTDRFAERMQMILDHKGLTGEEFETCRYHMLKHLKESASAVA